MIKLSILKEFGDLGAQVWAFFYLVDKKFSFEFCLITSAARKKEGGTSATR